MAVGPGAVLTLDQARAYLQVGPTDRDVFIESLIDSVSRAIERETHLTIAARSVVDTLDGPGRAWLRLSRVPYVSLQDASVVTDRDPYTVEPVAVTAEDQVNGLLLHPTVWPRGVQNVVVNYTAGVGPTGGPFPDYEEVPALAYEMLQFSWQRATSGIGMASAMSADDGQLSVAPEWPSGLRRRLRMLRRVSLGVR